MGKSKGMITVIICTLLCPVIFGRHWSNFVAGLIIGLISAIIFGFILPCKVSQECKIIPEKIQESYGNLFLTFVENGKIERETEESYRIGSQDILMYRKYSFSDPQYYYFGINLPFWYAHIEITKETAKKLGIL